MKTSIKYIMLATLSLFTALITFQVHALDDSCDAELERQIISVQVTAGTITESDDNTSFQVSCSESMESIQNCAMVSVSKDPVQTFCFPEDDRPSYTEEYFVLQYYGEP